MTIDDIKKLIASDESRTLELKKTTGELKTAMHGKGWLLMALRFQT